MSSVRPIEAHREEQIERLRQHVPAALREYPAWLLYKLVPKPDKPGKFDKIPYYVSGAKRRGTQGSVADVAQLAHFHDALRALESNPMFDGVGIAVLAQFPFGAVDLDDIATDSERLAFASKFRGTALYGERSPSGKGERWLYAGKLGIGNHKKHDRGVELFETTGFVTITGDEVSQCAELDVMPDEIASQLSAMLSSTEKALTVASAPEWRRAPFDAVPDHLQFRVDSGWQPDCQDRSASLFGMCRQLRDAGVTAEMAYFILGDHQNPWFALPLERRHGDINSARQWLWKHNIVSAWAEGVNAGQDTQSGEGEGNEQEGDDDLRLLTLDEFVQPPMTSYLVRDVIPCQSLVVIYGPPKCGKSFSTTDLTMHAAHGINWQGHKVARPVRVAYLAGEGTRGLKVRLHAWLTHHDNIEAKGEFRVLPKALSLPDNTDAVIKVLKKFAPDIVVTDTLNRYFGPGDENATVDMTRFCAAASAVKDALGCTVIVIHHTGHGEQQRERGSIVLRGSADVMIQVGRDSGAGKNIGFQVVGARDMEEMSEPVALRLKRVETDWLDQDGQHETTCIVEAADAPVTLTGRGKPLGSAQATLLEAAQGLARARANGATEVVLPRMDVTARAKEMGVSRQSASSAWAALAGRNLVRLIEPGSVAVKVRA